MNASVRLRRLILLSVVGFLYGCAGPTTQPPQVHTAAAAMEAQKQRDLVFRDRVTAEQRLNALAYPLLRENAEACGDNVRYTLGLRTWSIHGFAEENRDTAERLFALSGAVTIAQVLPGSPAEAAGLRVGDVIGELGGRPVAAGETAVEDLSTRLDELLQTGQPVSMLVVRQGAHTPVTATPTRACAYSVVLMDGEEINAFADGKRIVVMKGLVDFARDDGDLSTVLAHELAHNAMGHVDAQQANAAVGAVFGAMFDIAAALAGVNTGGNFSTLGAQAGRGVYSVAFENEADYAGLYFMARAGLDIETAPDLWRRMAVMNPESIALRVSHPTTPERFLTMELAVDEIRRKQDAGLPLLPETRPGQALFGPPSENSPERND